MKTIEQRRGTLMTKRTIAILALAAALMSAGAARAQGVEVRGRSGLTVGIGLGLGNMGCEGNGCEDVTEAAGIDGHIGVMLIPRLALIGELWGMGHTEDRVTITQTIATIGAQLWLTRRLWLRGGLGVAHSSFNYDGDLIDISSRSDTVPGFTLGAGIEVVATRHFALDLSLRGGTGVYEDDTRVNNLMLGVGASWY